MDWHALAEFHKLSALGRAAPRKGIWHHRRWAVRDRDGGRHYESRNRVAGRNPVVRILRADGTQFIINDALAVGFLILEPGQRSLLERLKCPI